MTEPSPVLDEAPVARAAAPTAAPVVAAAAAEVAADTALVVALGGLMLFGLGMVATLLPFGRAIGLGLCVLGLHYPNRPGALADYAVSVGPAGVDGPDEVTPEVRGAFQRGIGFRFADFTDGLSQTILMGEKHVARQRFGRGFEDSSVYNAEYPTSSTRGLGRMVPLASHPNDTGWSFGGPHTGVVLFVVGDGSVTRLAVRTDPGALERLSTRDDGETVIDLR